MPHRPRAGPVGGHDTPCVLLNPSLAFTWRGSWIPFHRGPHADKVRVGWYHWGPHGDFAPVGWY